MHNTHDRGAYDLNAGLDDIDAHGSPAPYEDRIRTLETIMEPDDAQLKELEFLRFRRCYWVGIPAKELGKRECRMATWYIDWEKWSPKLPAEEIPAATIDEPGRLSHAAWDLGPRPRAWRAEFDGRTLKAELSEEWL